MKTGRISQLLAGTAIALCFMTGCVRAARPLYYWGSYQPEVYDYFKDGGGDPAVQQAKLEMTAQQAAAKGMPLPPGFNAHLGLLYLKTGQSDKARQAFQNEEIAFPESKAYMDFLMKKLPLMSSSAPVTLPQGKPATPVGVVPLSKSGSGS